jgi:hypothetical protein
VSIARDLLTPLAPEEPLHNHRTRYNIAIVPPLTIPGATVFWDIGKLLLYSFQSLGYAAKLTVNRFERDAVNILLCYQAVSRPQLLAGVRYIVYQLEQLTDVDDDRRGARLRPEDFELMRGAEVVWEYSEVNRAYLQSKGIHVRMLPFGYHNRMETIAPAPKDIDVLFFGIINARRKALLTELARNCRLVVLNHVYGRERDACLARAKIVVNVHLFAVKIMEQPRISYLLNNRIFVVSEASAVNPYEGFLFTAPYEGLVFACLRYLADDVARERQAERGYAHFRRRPMVDYLRTVLDPRLSAGLSVPKAAPWWAR